jgi:hypothetical protein
MSDLFRGQTMTYAQQFTYDAGGAFTFTIPFQADKISIYNYTSWADTSGTPLSVWFRGMPAGDALQWLVIADNGGTGNKNVALETTNGYTVADTSGGVTDYKFDISAVSAADPCEVTTSASHGYSTGQLVRITDLGDVGPNAAARGMQEINNLRFKIVVTAATTFTLQDPISGDDIDSTAYTAYVSGGRVTLESRALNDPEAFAYLPVIYKITAGSAIFTGASDADVMFIEAIKFGEFGDLGNLADLR